ncbi:hypothetical protein [Sphingomonas melonis]|uniref:hypothetical protein n=1 Tax=Sphingomonas melonis TaxID=152682 RepID=UPI0035C81744
MSFASIFENLPAPKPDITVTSCGTIAIVNLLTPAAREWVDEAVEVPSWAWMGLGFGCEPRLLGTLLDGAADAGLEVLQ